MKMIHLILVLLITPVAIAGVSWIVFLRLVAKTKTAYGGQLAAFVKCPFKLGIVDHSISSGAMNGTDACSLFCKHKPCVLID